MSLRFFVLISLILLNLGQSAFAASDFQKLKAHLQGRQGEPKVFLPDRVIIGQPADIVVMAPGAHEITLYGTVSEPDFIDRNLTGSTDEASKKDEKLGPNLEAEAVAEPEPKKDLFGKKLLGKKQLAPGQTRATFKVVFEDKDYMNQLCSFEALISYGEAESEDEMFRALAFGSNAAYRGSYLVRIIDTPRAKANPLDSINALIPGLGKPLNFRQGY